MIFTSKMFSWGLVRRKIVSMLVACLFFSAMLGIMKEIVSFKIHFSELFHQKPIGEDFMRLLKYMANEKEVGFITDLSTPEYIVGFYQACNALSPIIIRENLVRPLTIGFLSSAKSVNNMEKKNKVRLVQV